MLGDDGGDDVWGDGGVVVVVAVVAVVAVVCVCEGGGALRVLRRWVNLVLSLLDLWMDECLLLFGCHNCAHPQFSALDALAWMMMKGAAKCDKHAE